MRMFLYFFFHSAWNQLKSFVRSWAFIVFVLLFAVGGLLWYGFLWYYRYLAASNSDLPENLTDFLRITELSGLNTLELAAGILILALLFFQMILAERSFYRLFKQADVNLLFSSDLSPQRILAFRVTNTLGLGILAAVILAAMIPRLVSHYGIGVYGAISIFLSWCILLGFSVLIKILIYEVASRHPRFHRNLRWILIAILAAAGIAFYFVYHSGEDRELFLAANRFFNAPGTRWIPVWGWIKGVMMYGLEGNVLMSVSMLCLNLALIAVMVLLARKLPADYYEETLSSAQEEALLSEEVQSAGASLLVMRTKKRRVNKEGFHFGNGSSVYFFRVFHNRLRTSRFLISKTMLTYSFVALAAGLYVRFFLYDKYEYIPVIVLAVMVFFRTIISSVTEDIRKDLFFLQPEPVWKKLFFSLLGGSCNCGADVFFPLMIGCAAAGFSPLRGLLYLPMLMSVDFFASASGAFTDVSIPSSIGTGFKQVIQIILLYAGLIFDAVVLIFGLRSGQALTGFLLVTLLDILFGGTFLGLAGVWLYPHRGRAVKDKSFIPDTKNARKAFTRVGAALTAMFLSIHLAQVLISRTGAGPLLSIYLPIYLIGLPVFLLLCVILKNPEPVSKPPVSGNPFADPSGNLEKSRPLPVRKFLLLIPACLFVAYAGNLIGLLFQGIYSALVPAPLQLWQTADTGGEGSWIQILLLAFASPIMEEFVFRRCVLGRLRLYGEKAALLTSALLFALFHGTVSQFFYAFGLGLVFGYVYLKTNRLRYSMILHVIINGMSTILLPALLAFTANSGGADLNRIPLQDAIQNPGVLLLILYLFFLLVLALFGAVVFFFGVREREVSPDGVSMKTVFSSWGILMFFAAAVTMLI